MGCYTLNLLHCLLSESCNLTLPSISKQVRDLFSIIPKMSENGGWELYC